MTTPPHSREWNQAADFWLNDRVSLLPEGNPWKWVIVSHSRGRHKVAPAPRSCPACQHERDHR